jgi:CheY-like chemotaxis protein
MATAAVNRPVEVLLVEDNPGDIRLIEEALKETSLRIHLNVARDGVEALDFLRKTDRFADAARPDLVLLDLNLPRKNGGEVLSEVKADPDLKRIPVLVMTTSQNSQDVRRAYQLNANSYIVKPTDLDAFLHTVKSIEEFWLKTATLPTFAPPR